MSIEINQSAGFLGRSAAEISGAKWKNRNGKRNLGKET